jgi:hypothetical protein
VKRYLQNPIAPFHADGLIFVRIVFEFGHGSCSFAPSDK